MGQNGKWVENEHRIAQEFQSYFKDLFSSDGDLSMDNAIDSVDKSMDNQMVVDLLLPFTRVEIFDVLSQMHPTKAPRYDGMPTLFLKKIWHFIHHDILDLILKILNHGLSPECIN